MTDNISDLKEDQKITTIVLDPPKEQSIEVPDKTEDDGHNNAWVGGLVLIGIGIVFLIMNLTDYQLNNWWALFILIPAIAPISNAVRVYRQEGRLGQEGRGSLLGGLIMLFIGSAFLFGWNWGNIWPVFLVMGGIGLLLNAFLD